MSKKEKKMSKVALITGSAKRIGKEIAIYLHQQGYDIIVHYYQSDVEAKELTNSLNLLRQNSSISIMANLSRVEEIHILSNDSIKWKGQINLLINNASLFKLNLIGNTTDNEWEKIFDSTAKGSYFLAQNLSQELSKSKGLIINILDTKYQSPRKDFSLYSMAKSVLAMQTKCFAIDLAPDVRVNGIALGHYKWPESKVYTSLEKSKIISNIPLKRSGTVSSLSKTIDYIIANEFLTGEIIHVDGGQSLNSFSI